MIEALIAGERDPARLADLALRRLRRKTDVLQMACDGRFTRSHAQMCRLHLDAYDHLTGQIAELDALVAEAAAPFGRLIARLVTIPGIGRRTGGVIIAETGGDMARFATPARLAAPTRKGDQHLRTAMVESAWATWRTATRPGARFRRLARRFGKGNEKKAAVAVAHTLLCIAWAVMHYDGDYIDVDTDYYERRDQRNREHLVRYHQQALARLGLQVILAEPGDGSPPPAPGTPPPARPPDPYRTSPAGHHNRLRRRCRAPGWGPQVSSQARPAEV